MPFVIPGSAGNNGAADKMEWNQYSSYSGVFVEITKADQQHGGAGWEFGTCLWSPTRNRVGADRYSIMRRVRRGDLVLHFYARRWPDGQYESRLAGRSVASTEAHETDESPPSAGDWVGMSPYYRIELAAYESFPSPLPLQTLVRDYGDEILGDIANVGPKFYPFNPWRDTVRTVQGIYLAEATSGLYAVLRRALAIEESDGDDQRGDVTSEYAEGRRLARERYYFDRNPALVTAAKRHHGYDCMVCGFSFGTTYGEIGHDYIECHHKDPLSERAEEQQLSVTATTIEDVAVVCSNCHRMLHRRRPALGIEELRATLPHS